MSTAELLHRAIFAVFLLRCLKSQGYFPTSSTSDDSLTEDEAYIGSLLVHFLEVLQFNSHEVAEYEMTGRSLHSPGQSVFVGAAVYPPMAMFNHSCDPGVVRYYVQVRN